MAGKEKKSVDTQMPEINNTDIVVGVSSGLWTVRLPT